MKFEWDTNKSISNLRKHKVSFELASEIFHGSPALTFDDSRFEYQEIRSVAVGEVEGICLYVVYTERGDTIRLISARKANKKERKAYYDYITRTAIRDS